jgi:NAD(P)-dependent dehydrogenase (short-subunit alcohol dehydrogenase family)
MNVEGSVALVTGANRGIGAVFARMLLEQGASKVYAAARTPETVTIDGVTPITLDITSAHDIEAVVERCADVNLLINNAGISTGTGVLAPDALEQGRREMETNAFGGLAMSRGFAPVLAANGGGAIVNVLSALSWFSLPQTAMYCASKAAAWSLTNSLRVELHPQGTLVVGVHCAFVDTDMAAQVTAEKISPEQVVELTIGALERNEYEVLADDTTRGVRAALSGDVALLYPALA